MSLMRVFSKVDMEGKVVIPGNIQRAAGLKEGQLVELKIVGASAKRVFSLHREKVQGSRRL